MINLNKTLAERGARYGAFSSHAKITQAIKSAFVATPNWDELSDSMRECLDMVAHKIGRILNGDPKYLDSWVDLMGYARLVVDELEAEAKAEQMAREERALEQVGSYIPTAQDESDGEVDGSAMAEKTPVGDPSAFDCICPMHKPCYVEDCIHKKIHYHEDSCDNFCHRMNLEVHCRHLTQDELNARPEQTNDPQT